MNSAEGDLVAGGTTAQPSKKKRSDRKSRETRITGAISGDLRKASVLSVVAGALWPVQAACIAWAVSEWAKGTGTFGHTLLAAGGFLIVAVIRAALEYRSGGVLFEASNKVIARERDLLITREALAPGAASARIGAMIAQKLPMLQPWITRYRVAMARTMVLPILYLALAFYFSWAVGLTFLIAGPLIPLFMALVGMAAEDASRRQLTEIGSMNEMLMDRLAAMQDIRLLGASDSAADDFAKRAETLRSRTMAVLRIAFLSSTVLELFAALGVALVAVLVGFDLLGSISWIGYGTPVGIGAGIFLLLLAPEYFQPLRDLAAAWHDRASGLAVAAELEELDKLPRQRLLGEGSLAEPLPGALHLQLSAVTVNIGPRLLRLPEFELNAGEAVALVGPSGAGKTTTLAAVAGLLPVWSGHVNTCGYELSDANADAWRARLSLVPQIVHFADETLAEFLDPNRTGQDPWAALEMADAAGIVRNLHDGLDTRLGETGGGVSGGEARRLMLARAILSGGELLLVDEPTADLDPQTAARITAALLRLKAAGHTLLVATHDPELVAQLDRAIEVDA